ncbi:serine hydrolase domain-containing protein [Devosia sp.]|uniref:serine hydrolase domain-containing protein n=1 Tax=Devosia sp. TaxID=1871048 RepID=UPI003BAAB066
MAHLTSQDAAETAGFTPGLSRKLAAGVESGLLPYLHAVIVSREGGVVLEQYYSGADEDWGMPLGEVTFGPDVLHDLRSVTKSIVCLLYGIALDRGLVPALDSPIVLQFPEYADLADDADRQKISVEHAMTMSMGLEWDEDLPYTNPENSEIAMERAADRYRYILERPIVAAPGTRWIYSGGAVALIGALIARGTGMPLQRFAEEALFGPLGITHFSWAQGADGVASAASGLRLSARDLLKIGELLVAGGRLGERQIVPEAWIEASFTSAINADGLGYGRLWFIGETPVPALDGPGRWVAGFGNGGQRLWLCPAANTAAVVFAGHYNKPDAWVTPTRIWREIVLANLQRP